MKDTISRRELLTFMAAGVATLPLPEVLAASRSLAPKGESTKPNVIVICSDEHHPLLAGYRGHGYVKTPNLDRLAARGVHFTRNYCSCPVCTPSRMSFITGKYVHQIDSWMIGVPLDREEMTWPRRLGEVGIPSTCIGKLDACGKYQECGFSDFTTFERRPAWSVYPRQTPYAPRLEGYKRKDKRLHLQNAGTSEEHIPLLVRKVGEDEANSGVFHFKHHRYFGFYGHDREVTRRGLEFLKTQGAKKDGGQWALYLGYLQPHWPFIVPKKYFDMYYPDNITMPHDAEFPLNEKLHPAVQHFQKGLDLGDVPEDKLRRSIAAYYGMVTALDDMIGEVLDELEAQGLDDNTYIIYTSDHGESLGEHGLFYKQCAYEGSVGVPLIVSGPSIPAGRRVDVPTTLVDMYPTVLDMMGMKAESDRPGGSWLPLARGEKSERPDYAFSEFHGNFFKRAWYMLVRGDYKYIYYEKEKPSLFNVKKDPLEMNDLASDSTYVGVLQEFDALLCTITDPEATAMRAKKALGLVGNDGTDYCDTLTVAELKEARKAGRFKREPRRVR
jgi:choline-sulfatase